MRHGTSNPGQPPSEYRSVRCHPAYRDKERRIEGRMRYADAMIAARARRLEDGDERS